MDVESPEPARTGPWSDEAIRDFLGNAVIPIRIASNGSFPMVQSLWFVADGITLWCATQADSLLVRRLLADDRCGFEVSADLPPYRGVRGIGHAEVLAAEAGNVLPRLIDRYLGAQPGPLAAWLLSRLDDEVAIRITPERLSTWDYSARMATAHG